MTVHDSTGQYRTVQDSSGQYSTAQYSTVQYSTVGYLAKVENMIETENFKGVTGNDKVGLKEEHLCFPINQYRATAYFFKYLNLKVQYTRKR
jgi:hypothetical protein